MDSLQNSETRSPKSRTTSVKISRKMAGIAGGAAVLVLVATIIPIVVLIKPGQASTIPPTVATSYGRYEGSVLTTYDGLTVVRYAGIPFAQPPVGDLRFRPPEPYQAKSQQKTIKADKMKKSCWSITKKVTSRYYNEDCLYLNIYVPDKGNDHVNNQRYPVVVWIHGGGFVAGSAFPEPSKFVARGDVIVVMVNYRLGVFGFLTTGDDNLPANNGLWDQIMALRWVKDNICQFGGDSNSITLFGESAGAMSASILALSPESSSLFNRVIMQSGAASSLLRRNPEKMAKDFGEKAGCMETDPSDFASCIRNLTVETILRYSKDINIPAAGRQADFFWMPTIDKAILPDEPARLLNNDTYLASINAYDKDYLFGFNNNDGSIAIQNFMSPLSDDTEMDMEFFQEFTTHLLTITQDIPETSLKNISEMVTSFYAGSQSSNRVRPQSVMDLAADALFFGPGLNMANTVSSCYEDLSSRVCESNVTQVNEKPECVGASGRSFMYVFDYCPPRDGCNLPCMLHGYQVYYQFPKRAFKNAIDQELSDKLIDFLTDFIKTGQPGSNQTTEWPAYERNLQSYYSFSPYPIVQQYYHSYRMGLWLSDIPRILENMA